MNITLNTNTIIILLAIACAIVITCVITQKDTWEGIGNIMRKAVYICISAVFIGGIAFLVYVLCQNLTV